MTFKPKFAGYAFVAISIDKFLEKYKRNNPKEDLKNLRTRLEHFKKLKQKGEECNCGNPIWIIDSAIAGKGCFTCITGESDCSDDYEIV